MSEPIAPTPWELRWSHPLHLLAAHGVAHGSGLDLKPMGKGARPGRCRGALCRAGASLTHCHHIPQCWINGLYPLGLLLLEEQLRGCSKQGQVLVRGGQRKVVQNWPRPGKKQARTNCLSHGPGHHWRERGPTAWFCMSQLFANKSIFFKNKLLILEQFHIYRKIEKLVQGVPVNHTPSSSHC